jgi:hypothetical protein
MARELPPISLKTFRAAVDGLLDELFMSNDFACFVEQLEELNCKLYHDELVAHVIRTSLDRNDRERDIVEELIGSEIFDEHDEEDDLKDEGEDGEDFEDFEDEEMNNGENFDFSDDEKSENEKQEKKQMEDNPKSNKVTPNGKSTPASKKGNSSPTKPKSQKSRSLERTNEAHATMAPRSQRSILSKGRILFVSSRLG